MIRSLLATVAALVLTALHTPAADPPVVRKILLDWTHSPPRRAVEFQKKALADKTFEKDSEKQARERLKLSEQKKPWRE